MRTSGHQPRRTSSGSTSAALPTTPRERPSLLLAAVDRAIASSRSCGELVEVAGLEPALGAGLVDLDDERGAVVHRRRQRLRAAHPAEAGGDDGVPRSEPPKCWRAASAKVS